MLEVYIDGACEPVNPGGTASYGLVVRRSVQTSPPPVAVEIKKTLLEVGRVVGTGSTMSNNVAEYCALLAFLGWYCTNVKDNERAVVHSDSQLLVNQMKGLWKAKSGLYIPYFNTARNMLKSYRSIDFQWIPREQNTEADRLSKLALTRVGLKQ